MRPFSYVDVATDEVNTAALRVSELAFHSNGAQAERGVHLRC
jgi:hypothetical protein